MEGRVKLCKNVARLRYPKTVFCEVHLWPVWRARCSPSAAMFCGYFRSNSRHNTRGNIIINISMMSHMNLYTYSLHDHVFLPITINQSTDANGLASNHICWPEFMFYRPTNGPRVLSKFFDRKRHRVSDSLFCQTRRYCPTKRRYNNDNNVIFLVFHDPVKWKKK